VSSLRPSSLTSKTQVNGSSMPSSSGKPRDWIAWSENATDAGRLDALCQAAKKPFPEGVAKLLSLSVPAHGRCSALGTPLVAAIRGGNDEILERLLAAGAKADVNEKVGGTTPLHLALCELPTPYLRAASLLIANGADESVLDERGETAQQCASRKTVAAVAGLQGCVCHYLEHSAPPTSCLDPRCTRTE
jgi:ankyrin repeat protein